MKAFDARDDLFETAVEIVQQEGKGSTSLLQRKLRIGYTRASRLVEQLEAAGILSPDLGGTQGRTVLLDSYSADVADFHDLPSNKPRVIGGDKDANGSDHEFWF